MLLNQTPVRTSKNYKINNIEVDEHHIPSSISDFFGLTITGDTSNFSISSDVSKKKLKYGNGIELENQIFNNNNQNLKIFANKKGTLYLEFNFNEDDKDLVENIEIISKEKSNSTIVIKYYSDDDSKNYHNGIIRVNSEKSSTINIIVINMLNLNSTNLLSIENTLEENATVNYTMVDFGGKTSITNYYSNVFGKEAKANLNTIYLGTGKQTFDINYIAELFGEKTETNIEVQGALKDEAKKNFKGTIDFKKGCRKAKGNENEYCMLLSDKARSKALPMLLCTEEVVEGNHSSSAGKIEDDILFYIMSYL